MYWVKIQLIELMQFIESLVCTHVPFDKLAKIDTIESIYQMNTIKVTVHLIHLTKLLQLVILFKFYICCVGGIVYHYNVSIN